MGLLIFGGIIAILILFGIFHHRHTYTLGNGKCLTCGKLHRDYCPAPNCYPTQTHDYRVVGQSDPRRNTSTKYYECQNCNRKYTKHYDNGSW